MESSRVDEFFVMFGSCFTVFHHCAKDVAMRYHQSSSFAKTTAIEVSPPQHSISKDKPALRSNLDRGHSMLQDLPN